MNGRQGNHRELATRTRFSYSAHTLGTAANQKHVGCTMSATCWNMSIKRSIIASVLQIVNTSLGRREIYSRDVEHVTGRVRVFEMPPRKNKRTTYDGAIRKISICLKQRKYWSMRNPKTIVRQKFLVRRNEIFWLRLALWFDFCAENSSLFWTYTSVKVRWIPPKILIDHPIGYCYAAVALECCTRHI